MKPTCPICHSTKVIRRGNKPKLKFQCIDPKHPGGHRYFYDEKSPAKVLILDIETLPGWKRFWRLGEEDWNIDSIVYDWMLLGFAYKWLFEPESYATVLTPKEALSRDDSRLVNEMWTLFNDADVIIAHNGDNFDIPKVMGKFLEYGYVPPSPYLTLDTKKEAARIFGMTSNKLDWLARKLGLPTKLPTDYGLWVKCEAGDKEALAYMKDYNEQDIWTLEDVYVRLRAYIRHPNMALFVDVSDGTKVCPVCGETKDVHWVDGKSHLTQARKYRVFHCGSCGAWGRPFQSSYTTTSSRAFK